MFLLVALVICVVSLRTACAGSPFPTERITAHAAEFNKITDFLVQRGFTASAFVGEEWDATLSPKPEYKWFEKKYPGNALLRVLVLIDASGAVDVSMSCQSARQAVMDQITADFNKLSEDLKREMQPKAK